MEELISGGLRVDEIPPERIFVVTVLPGRELRTEEHTVSRSRAVTRQGEIPGEAAWWVDIGSRPGLQILPCRHAMHVEISKNRRKFLKIAKHILEISQQHTNTGQTSMNKEE